MSKVNHSHQIKFLEEAKRQNLEVKEDLKTYIKDNKMLEALKRKKIFKLFPIQYMTYDYIYQRRDIVGRDRTGSGKTLAFALPIIMRIRQKYQSEKTKNKSVKFLIIQPTRELALQVRDEINSLRVSPNDFIVGAVYGGSGMNDQIQLVTKGVDILVATPGRLIDFLKRNIVNLQQIDCVCLDQADQMLNMGFKEDIERIFKYVNQANSRKTQNLLFSATVPNWIWDISRKYQQKNFKFIDLIQNSQIQTSKTVKHYRIQTPKYQRQQVLSGIIKHFLHGNNKKVIVFCETKREVQRINNLRKIPLRTQALHGDVKQFIRERVYNKFKYGNLQCIIATNVAARGLDFPQIDLIIQMQPPKTTDSYIHRSGRTGRAGNQGICVTLYDKYNENFLKKIIHQSKIQPQDLSFKKLLDLNSYQQLQYLKKDLPLNNQQIKQAMRFDDKNMNQKDLQREKKESQYDY